jgi:FkbM family methyltransferase
MAMIYKILSAATETLKAASGLATIQTHTFYVPHLASGTVIDLGANIGQFASAIADQGKACHAVEADPNVFRRIPDRKEITKHNLAITDRNGSVEFFLSENSEANSVQRAIAGGHGIKETISCPGSTLQAFLSQNGIDDIALLKVDIEGSEEHLFDSTPDDALKKMKQITVEFHDFIPGSISSAKVDQIARRLAALGFYRIPFSYMFPGALNADVLFVRLDNISLWKRGCFAAINRILQLQKLKAQLMAQATAS